MGFTPWAAHKMKAIVYISVINTFSYRQTVMNYLIEADWCKRPQEKVEYEAYIETRRKFLFLGHFGLFTSPERVVVMRLRNFHSLIS